MVSLRMKECEEVRMKLASLLAEPRRANVPKVMSSIRLSDILTPSFILRLTMNTT